MLSDGYHHPISLQQQQQPHYQVATTPPSPSSSSVIKENHQVASTTTPSSTTTATPSSTEGGGPPSDRQLQVPKVSAGPSPVITYHPVGHHHGGAVVSSVYTSHPKILHSMKSIAADMVASSKSVVEDALRPASPPSSHHLHHQLSVYGGATGAGARLYPHPVVVVVPKQESASSTTASSSPTSSPPVIMDNSVASSSGSLHHHANGGGGVGVVSNGGGNHHPTGNSSSCSPGPKGEPDLNIGEYSERSEDNDGISSRDTTS